MSFTKDSYYMLLRMKKTTFMAAPIYNMVYEPLPIVKETAVTVDSIMDKEDPFQVHSPFSLPHISKWARPCLDTGPRVGACVTFGGNLKTNMTAEEKKALIQILSIDWPRSSYKLSPCPPT